MMVDRRHPEDPLSVGLLEIADLDHDRKHLGEVDKADDHDKQRHLHDQRQGRRVSAQRQGTGVSHKDLRRIAVEQKKAEQCSDHCARHRRRRNALLHGRRQEEQGKRDGDGGTEPVQAVRKVHAVVRPEDDKEDRRNIQDAEFKEHAVLQSAGEGDQHPASRLRMSVEPDRQKAGGYELHHQLLLHAESLRLLFPDLQVIIEKTDEAVDHGEDQHRPHQGVLHHEGQCSRDDRDHDHDAAHGRRSLLLQVGLGTVVPDLLAEFHAVQHRDHNRAKRCTDHEGYEQRNDGICKHRMFPAFYVNLVIF